MLQGPSSATGDPDCDALVAAEVSKTPWSLKGHPDLCRTSGKTPYQVFCLYKLVPSCVSFIYQ